MPTLTEFTSTGDPDGALTHKIIGEIRGQSFVPGYQRGYRWDKQDVSRLLDDIWGSDGEKYSLCVHPQSKVLPLGLENG
jgi:uncharacterized protein with ParB-like and HNH nuclease domain